jgi:protein-S-isoprenylcysteine O-methyltransferase Ste14
VPEAALALYLLFLALAFGWRSWRQWRHTGDLGFRGFSGSAGPLERATGASFAIALVAIALLPLGRMHGIIESIPALDRPAAHRVGLLLACLGIGITVLAQVQMGRSWRIGVDASEVTDLVQHGLFGLVRNPIFSGMLFATLGLALLVPSAFSAATWLLLAATIELQVRCVEEPYLAATHGKRYRDYAARVGRFLPGLGRLD